MGRRLLYRRNGWPRPAAVQEEHCVAARAAPNQVDGAVLAGPQLSFSEKVMVMYNSGSEKRGNLITSAI